MKAKNTREQAKIVLLQSLLKGRRYLDTGRSPVDAVELAMEMVNAKPPLIRISNNWVTITEYGHLFLQDHRALPPAGLDE